MRTVVKICGNESQRGLQIVIFIMNGEIMIWLNFNIQRIFFPEEDSIAETFEVYS